MSNKKDDTITVELDNRLEELFGSDDDEFGGDDEENESSADFDELFEEDYCDTCPYPWEGLNKKTYGIRTGELVCFTSGAGMGKSSIIRELAHHLLKNTKDNL